MRTRSLIAMLAGAGALAAGATGTVGAQGPGQQQGADRTIVVYEKEDGGSFKFVDAKPFTRFRKGAPRRISPGDAFFVRGPVYSDAATTQPAGTLSGSCRASNGSRRFDRIRWLCDGVFETAEGTLDFHGTFTGEAPVRFAVVGGTQGFEGDRGQLSFEEQSGSPTKITIHLLGNK